LFQIGNVPSNLCIVDFSHGHTGSCHDARAFEGTAAHKYPNWLFSGEEFAWMDSAYPCTSRSIPVHKEPVSLIPRNAIFDRYVSRLRVRSEHAIGALKGRFQCLQGLCLQINSKSDHVEACRWVTIAIILHNIVVELEDTKSAPAFAHIHTNEQEEEDRGWRHESDINPPLDGEAKRQMLINELMTYRLARDKLANEN
jgi:DDE superfamily endonuclease